MGKKNVHKLSLETGQLPVLIGISSHENDYRLSWLINEHTGLHFVKAPNHSAYNIRLKINQEFSMYTYNQGGFTYRLVSNRCDNGFLLEELKNMDFLLLVEENDVPFPVNDFIATMKVIPFIAAVFKFDINTLKNKNRLLFYN
jgi:hypothetical protein